MDFVVVIFIILMAKFSTAENEILTKLAQLEQRVSSLEVQNKEMQNQLSMYQENDNFRNFDGFQSALSSLRNRTEELEKACSTSIERKYRQQPSSGIAFYAYISHAVNQIGLNQPIVFDSVKTNNGGGYNSGDGVFAVPVTGVYVFYWNLLVNTHPIDTTLYTSNGPLAYNYAETGSSSNMAIARLVAGTHVWVKKADSYGNYLHERFSSFSGFLLYQDE